MFIDLEGAMAENCLDRIQLLLTICKSLGFSYFTPNKKSTSTILSIITYAIRFTVAIIYVIGECYYITSTKWDITSKTVMVTDITIGVVCFVLKWPLYYSKRKTMENIILKVTEKKLFLLTALLTSRWLS